MTTAWGRRRAPDFHRLRCLGVMLNNLAMRRWVTPSALNMLADAPKLVVDNEPKETDQ